MSARITVDSMPCHGKPCIRGLRYPEEKVLEWLASGTSTEEISVFSPTDLRVILEQVSKHSEEIERGWNEHFS
jgi:uncharacterized protein (DUF433 family)